jgi:O-antigen/teichoic acid export membrane protein
MELSYQINKNEPIASKSIPMLLKNESLSKKFITKWAWMYFFALLSAPMSFIINIILTNDLTKVEFWIIYSVIGFLTFFGTYTDFWLTESLNYFLPKYILKNDYARGKFLLFTTLAVQMCTSIIIWLWLYFSAWWLGEHYFHETQVTQVLQIFTLYFIGIHFLQVIITFFWSIQLVKIQKFIEFFRTIITAIGMALLLYIDRGSLIAYSWIWISSIYITCILAVIIFYFWYYRTHFNLPYTKDPILKKEFFHYSIGTLFSANIAWLLHNIDQQFLTFFLGVEDVGSYKIYLSLVGIPFIFFGPILAFLYPVISELWGRWEKDKIQMLFQVFSSYMAVFALWVWGFFIMVGWYLPWFIYNDSYRDAGVALYFIAPFLVLNVLSQIQFQILSGLGHVRKRIIILLWTLLVSIPTWIVCILGYKYGYLPFPSGSSAAAFSVGVSWIIMWYISLRDIWEYWRWFDWRFFIKNTIIVSGVVVLFRIGVNYWGGLFGGVWRWEYFPPILLAIVVCLIIFLLVNIAHIRRFLHIIKNVRRGEV